MAPRPIKRKTKRKMGRSPRPIKGSSKRPVMKKKTSPTIVDTIEDDEAVVAAIIIDDDEELVEVTVADDDDPIGSDDSSDPSHSDPQDEEEVEDVPDTSEEPEPEPEPKPEEEIEEEEEHLPDDLDDRTRAILVLASDPDAEDKLWKTYTDREVKIDQMLEVTKELILDHDKQVLERESLIERKQELDIKVEALQKKALDMESKMGAIKEQIDSIHSHILDERALQEHTQHIIDRLTLELELTHDEIWLRDYWFNANRPLLEHLAASIEKRDKAIALAKRGEVAFEVLGIDEERRKLDKQLKDARKDYVTIDGITPEMVQPLFDLGYHTLKDLVAIPVPVLTEDLGIDTPDAMTIRTGLDSYYYEAIHPEKEVFSHIVHWQTKGDMEDGPIAILVQPSLGAPEPTNLPPSSFKTAGAVLPLEARCLDHGKVMGYTDDDIDIQDQRAFPDLFTMAHEIELETDALTAFLLDSGLTDSRTDIVVVRVRPFMEDGPGLIVYDNTLILESTHIRAEASQRAQTGPTMVPASYMKKVRRKMGGICPDLGDTDPMEPIERITLYDPELTEAFVEEGYQVLVESAVMNSDHYMFLLMKACLGLATQHPKATYRLVEIVVNNAMFDEGLGPVLDIIHSSK